MARTLIQSFLYGREHEAVSTKEIPWARAVLVGRVLVGAIFIVAGIAKLATWSDTAAAMRDHGLFAVDVLLAIAAAVEIVGGLSVVTGTAVRAGALALIVYLVPTTLVFHGFWGYEGVERQDQLVQFLKNLSIAGGLLVLLGYGAGRVSVDARIKDRIE